VYLFLRFAATDSLELELALALALALEIYYGISHTHCVRFEMTGLILFEAAQPRISWEKSHQPLYLYENEKSLPEWKAFHWQKPDFRLLHLTSTSVDAQHNNTNIAKVFYLWYNLACFRHFF
jgi:hypothetical protein